MAVSGNASEEIINDDELHLFMTGWSQRPSGKWIHSRLVQSDRVLPLTRQQAIAQQDQWEPRHRRLVICSECNCSTDLCECPAAVRRAP